MHGHPGNQAGQVERVKPMEPSPRTRLDGRRSRFGKGSPASGETPLLVWVWQGALIRFVVAALTGVVILLLLSLLPMTPLFVPGWRGSWVFSAAAWAALGPAVVVLWMLARSLAVHRGVRMGTTGSADSS